MIFLGGDDQADAHVQLSGADQPVQPDQLLIRDLGAAAQAAQRVAEGDNFRFQDSRDPLQPGDDDLLSLREEVGVDARVGRSQLANRYIEAGCDKGESVSRLDYVDGAAGLRGNRLYK